MDYVIVNDELMHYGVKGQKWGVRRYQNKDGSLTPAGKKRARQEVRADNKKAYELGKDATIYGHAAAKSTARTIKLGNKLSKQYEKDPDGVSGRTKRLMTKRHASVNTTLKLENMYRQYKDKAEQHCKELIDKYGKEAVSDIKYKDVKLPKGGKHSPSSFKTINERTNDLSDYARSGALTLFSASFSTLLGAPLYYVYAPKTTGEKAADLERDTYYTARKELKNKGR